MADLIASPRPAVVITDDTPAEQIAEALGHLNQRAKRQQYIVGTEDRPSPWDLAHRSMDGPLDDWLARRGIPA